MEHKNLNIQIFICIITIILFSVQSNSTTILELSLKELCLKSSDIITVRTNSINSYMDQGNKRIFTEIEIEVIDNIKGRLQKREKIKLILYGGKVNGITTLVVGAPQFTIGEESLLFLFEKQSFQSGQYFFTVVGMSQGKFNIFKDKETNEKRVLRDQIQMPLKLEKHGHSLDLTISKPINLAIFLSHINSYIK